jgi:adenosylmethionine-8-amino-7-oxononanoate aminotransferase
VDNDWQANVKRIEKALKENLSPCQQLESVQEVRVLGAIGVVEMKQPVDMVKIQPAFVEHGIWVRPFGKLVYVMPAYIMSNEQIATLGAQIYKVLSTSA